MIKCPKCGSENITPNKIGLWKVLSTLFWAIISASIATYYWPVWILFGILCLVLILFIMAYVKGLFVTAVTQWKCKRCKTIFNVVPQSAAPTSN
jgi:RNA polymerase subunit RPABC4/transcription elongation factor Spt4